MALFYQYFTGGSNTIELRKLHDNFALEDMSKAERAQMTQVSVCHEAAVWTGPVSAHALQRTLTAIQDTLNSCQALTTMCPQMEWSIFTDSSGMNQPYQNVAAHKAMVVLGLHYVVASHRGEFLHPFTIGRDGWPVNTTIQIVGLEQDGQRVSQLSFSHTVDMQALMQTERNSTRGACYDNEISLKRHVEMSLISGLVNLVPQGYYMKSECTYTDK